MAFVRGVQAEVCEDSLLRLLTTLTPHFGNRTFCLNIDIGEGI